MKLERGFMKKLGLSVLVGLLASSAAFGATDSVLNVYSNQAGTNLGVEIGAYWVFQQGVNQNKAILNAVFLSPNMATNQQTSSGLYMNSIDLSHIMVSESLPGGKAAGTGIPVQFNSPSPYHGTTSSIQLAVNGPAGGVSSTQSIPVPQYTINTPNYAVIDVFYDSNGNAFSDCLNTVNGGNGCVAVGSMFSATYAYAVNAME